MRKAMRFHIRAHFREHHSRARARVQFAWVLTSVHLDLPLPRLPALQVATGPSRERHQAGKEEVVKAERTVFGAALEEVR